MNIIQAIRDKNLFRPFLGSLKTWKHWMVAMRCLYGLPLNPSKKDIIFQCTGRDINKLPVDGFNTALFLTGRRSGKSRVAGIIAAFEGALSGKEKKLAKGEIGLVAVIAPTKRQAGIVRSYIRAIFSTVLLEQEIIREDKESFILSNGVHITVLVGDWRSVRGFPLSAVVIDEAAFFGLDEESKVRSDTELVRAIQPSLATVNGRLIAISSPYAKKGWCFNTYTKHFGNNAGSTLVWNCASQVMNPTLSQQIIDRAMEEDRTAALSEYGGQFRDDIGAYLPREIVETVVVRGRKELLPKTGIQYVAFCDVSGGRGDDATIGIGHQSENRKVVVDFIKRYRPPHSPYEVIASTCEELRRFGIRQCRGDNYSAEFVKQAFQSNGIKYDKSELPKSQLYLELLPRICSNAIELLDDEILIGQLASLERRTRSGGRDIIDHPQGGHDDIANVVAGLSAVGKQKLVGAFR